MAAVAAPVTIALLASQRFPEPSAAIPMGLERLAAVKREMVVSVVMRVRLAGLVPTIQALPEASIAEPPQKVAAVPV